MTHSVWKTAYPKLCDWSVVYGETDPYKPPELQTTLLHGKVLNHPKLGTKRYITTSFIVGKTNDGCIKTNNTIYELGEPSDEYEKLYPNSKKRLFESLELIEEEEQLENTNFIDFKLEVVDIIDGSYQLILRTDRSSFKVNPKSSIAQCVSFFVDKCKRNEKEDDEICDNDVAYANMILDGCKSEQSKYYKIGNRVVDVYKEEKLRCKTNIASKLQAISEWHNVIKNKNV